MRCPAAVVPFVWILHVTASTVDASGPPGSPSPAPNGDAVVAQQATTYRGPTVDFDGDGRADIAVYRPNTGVWYAIGSASGQPAVATWGCAGPQQYPWGGCGDVPVPGDYDGDGRTDVAIFRSGVWHIHQSSTGQPRYALWGWSNDQPMPADYDGDGQTDLAVYRWSTSEYYVLSSATGQWQVTPLPTAGFGPELIQPIAGDYDGDGLADPAIYRRGDAGWIYRASRSGLVNGYAWGWATDTPIPGDYDGDGVSDFAVLRHFPTGISAFIRRSTNGLMAVIQIETASSLPVPADYDGDGRTDVAVFRPIDATWLIRDSSTQTQHGGPTRSVRWGWATDIPLTQPTGSY